MKFAKDRINKMIVCLIMILNVVFLNQIVSYAACSHPSRSYEDQGDGRHKIYCSSCGIRFGQGTHSYGSWKTTRSATCTQSGKQTRKCKYCSASETRYTGKLDHDWSSWKKSTTEHWKECHNCDATDDEGNHYDNNVDGYCDECNYLMAIPASATISGAVKVKEGASASFSIDVTKGTTPIEYQWYYNTTNSVSNGVLINGATGTSITIATTDRSMNGRYYYCAMKNKAGTKYSPTALLTVYYPFTIGTQPQNATLKKGEKATFNVAVGTKGNPNSYTYQWFVASSESETDLGSKINGATTSSYEITPIKNVHAEYFYCVVSNGQYTLNSNRAKLVADITIPEIEMGTFDDNRIINKEVTVEIPFTVTDTGEGYTEDGNNFTADDIKIKVGGVVPTSLDKTLSLPEENDGKFLYKLTLSNINGNGPLSIEIPAAAVKDNTGNTSVAKEFSTRLIIDNKAPEINFEEITSGVNDVYANAEDTLIIRLSVTEAERMNPSLFTSSDVSVLVGGVLSNTDIEKELVYLEMNANKYLYQLTLKNVKGDGDLSLNIPQNSFTDVANNPNVQTPLDIKINENIVKIDNTKPVITGLVTTLGGYNTSTVYPTQDMINNHQSWSNENIYVVINAEDVGGQIDYYMKSTDDVHYSKIASGQEEFSISVNTMMYYRVVDKAGNSSMSTENSSKEIKLDKITPDKPAILLTEQRDGGAPYEFDSEKPTTKSVYVKIDTSTVTDKGNVQSKIKFPNSEPKRWTYYKVTRYKKIGDTSSISENTHYYNEGVLLNSSGYYEIKMYMEDIAGNKTESDLKQVYIEKGAENTIRIKNLNDIGSGLSKVTIEIYKGDINGNQTTEEAIAPIVIENPYKEIIKNVRLGDGVFYVKVTLEDKVGNSKVLSQKIENKL